MKTSLRKLGLTTCLRMSGVVLQTLIVMLVGRLVGPAAVGALQIFLTWTCSLGETVAAGLPTQAMRKLSNLESDRKRAGLFFKGAAIRMMFVWCFVMCLASAAWYLSAIDSLLDLGLIAISVFCFGLYRIVSESLKAFRDVDFSVLVESSMPPLVAALLLFGLHIADYQIGVHAVLVSFCVGFLVTCGLLLIRLIYLLGGFKTLSGLGQRMSWREHAPFWVISMISIAFLNYPFFVLPYFAEMNEIGTFALAFKLLNICTTILLLLGAIFGPKFSRLAEQGDLVAAGELLSYSRKISLLAFAPIGLGLIVLFPLVHPWFGEGFGGGFNLLLILVIGQLFNAATGLSGQFLNMAGHGSVEMRIQIMSLLIAIALTPVAGSMLGVTGIALVYTVTVMVRSLGSLLYANKITGSRPNLILQST